MLICEYIGISIFTYALIFWGIAYMTAVLESIESAS